MAIILTALAAMVAVTSRVWARIRADERGETTEKVIITALFAALALTVAAIITFKVTDKAQKIPTDPVSVTTVVTSGNGGSLGG